MERRFNAAASHSGGAQAASLFFSAACRKALYIRPKVFAMLSCCRQAAGNCRLAACAPPDEPCPVSDLRFVLRQSR
jgi:hypothetical protein